MKIPGLRQWWPRPSPVLLSAEQRRLVLLARCRIAIAGKLIVTGVSFPRTPGRDMLTHRCTSIDCVCEATPLYHTIWLLFPHVTPPSPPASQTQRILHRDQFAALPRLIQLRPVTCEPHEPHRTPIRIDRDCAARKTVTLVRLRRCLCLMKTRAALATIIPSRASHHRGVWAGCL